MSEPSEQTETPSIEEQVAKFSEMPKVEVIETLPIEVHKGLLEKFGASTEVEQENENSDTSKKQDSEKKQEKETDLENKEDSEDPDEKDDKDETSESDDKDEEEESEKSDSKELDKQKKEEKSRKNLQSEFTKRSQRLKAVEKENSDLRERLAKVEGILEGKSDQEKDSVETPDLSPLRELAKDNPKAEKLLNAIEATLDMQNDRLEKKFNKRFEKDEDSKKAETANTNLQGFRNKVSEFLDGPLAKLEDEFNIIAEAKFGDADTLEAAAKKDPELFDSLKGLLFSKYFDKVSELLDNVEDEKEEAGEATKRNKEINKTGVSKRSKTSADKSDPMNIKNFRKKNAKEMKELMRQHGRVSDE